MVSKAAQAPPPDDFLTLYCDPGEDFGWCLGYNFVLVSRGIERMWDTVLEAHDDIVGDQRDTFFRADAHIYDTAPSDLLKLRIGRIVCEDFRIYPWKMKALKFNPVRTARAIGGLKLISMLSGVDMILQPAAIKAAAVAAGAEELYDHPLHENRHSNDAVQHFVFFTNTELRGIKIAVPNEGVEGKDDGGVDD